MFRRDPRFNQVQTGSQVHSIYDGWNLVAELNGSNALQRSYLWGMDLSGSMQGAGGIGGLIAMAEAQDGSHFASYDGNGNLLRLVNAISGAISASYEYGPFGELLEVSGDYAHNNPFRFSTKYQDDETELLYYGYRYYSLETGRWLNRDPIEEKEEKGSVDYFSQASQSRIIG